MIKSILNSDMFIRRDPPFLAINLKDSSVILVDSCTVNHELYSGTVLVRGAYPLGTYKSDWPAKDFIVMTKGSKVTLTQSTQGM